MERNFSKKYQKIERVPLPQWDILQTFVASVMIFLGTYLLVISQNLLCIFLPLGGFGIIGNIYNSYRKDMMLYRTNNILTSILCVNAKSYMVFNRKLDLVFDYINQTALQNVVISNVKDIKKIFTNSRLENILDNLDKNFSSFEQDIVLNNGQYYKIYGQPIDIHNLPHFYIEIQNVQSAQYGESTIIRKFIDQSNQMFFIANGNGKVQYVNSVLLNNFNLNQTVLGKEISQALEGNNITFSILEESSRNLGFRNHNLICKSISKTSDGSLFQIISGNSQTDIKDVFDNSPIMMCYTDIDFNIKVNNNVFKNILKTQSNISNFLTILDSKTVKEIQQEAKKDGITEIVKNITIEYSNRFFPLRVHILAKNAGVKRVGWYVYMYNNEENDKVEKKLIHLQRLSMLGQSIAQIVHDISNNLSAALGMCDIIAEEMEQTTSFSIVRIKNVICRAANLARCLLTASKKESAESIVKDMNSTIRELIHTFIKPILQNRKKPIDIIYPVGNIIPPIRIEQTPFEQIVSNLMINAADALHNGGNITIKTDLIYWSDMDAKKNNMPVGNYALFFLSDNGIGMSEENLRRVCEPYFTTKTKGTGLGLSTVKTLVQNAGGFLEIFSKENVGTSFSIYLPLADSKQEFESATLDKEIVFDNSHDSEGQTTDVKKIKHSIHSHSILFIEDHNEMREVITRGLKQYGFYVHAAASGIDIIDMVKTENIKEVHVIISDVQLPDQPGPEVVKELEKYFPKVPVIFMSADFSIEGVDTSNPRYHFLLKPCGMPEIIKLINKCIKK